MLAPALAGLLVFFVYPLLASVYYSFTRYDLVTPPQWIGTRNYEFLFTKDPRVWISAGNTLWFVVILVPVRIVTAMIVAGILARAKMASGLWRTLFYLPALVPPVAGTVAFVFLFNPGTGPVNLILKSIGIQGPLWFNDPAWSKPSLRAARRVGDGRHHDHLPGRAARCPAGPVRGGLPRRRERARRRCATSRCPSISPVIIFAVVTGVIAALQYFTEAAVASGVASGKAVVGEGTGVGLGYPQGSLLTFTEWLYVRGFSQYQLGYASALAVLLFVVAAIFLIALLRQVKAFTPEELR